LLAAAFLFQGCASPGYLQAPSDPDAAHVHFKALHSEFHASKIRILNETMELSAEQSNKFWSIYRRYDQDLAVVADRGLENFHKFLIHHKAGTLNAQNSKELDEHWLQYLQDRLGLWQKYHQEISDAVSPIAAAQFLQVENRAAISVDMIIASEMPTLGISPPPTNK
jgi:hypothetical protein